MSTTTAKDGIYDSLLNKHDLPKFLRVSAWISRFLNNYKKGKEGVYKKRRNEKTTEILHQTRTSKSNEDNEI